MKDIIDSLNKIFESRIRLGVMSLLMVHDEMDFNALKEQLDLTDGNLASHIATLEKNLYVEVEKTFVGKTPHTVYSATKTGKKAFELHLDALEQLVKRNS